MWPVPFYFFNVRRPSPDVANPLLLLPLPLPQVAISSPNNTALETSIRSAEDIAFHAALWVARNGSFVNYYMYHGGTNFGRTGSAYVTTAYYDEAPLDEYEDSNCNLEQVSTQYGRSSMSAIKKFDAIEMWEEFIEPIINFEDTSLKSYSLLEHMSTTKDSSDYLWYTFSHQEFSDTQALLSVKSVGHVNGVAAGFRSISREQKCLIQDKKRSKDFTWCYQTVFDAPVGDDLVALNLGSMGKGEAWVNGQSIGRYWVSFLTPKGSPSQTWYHVPRSFLKPTGNVLVILEEEGGGYPPSISIDSVVVKSICGQVTASHYNNYKRREAQVHLQCPPRKHVTKILFASYGNPSVGCATQDYAFGTCDAHLIRDHFGVSKSSVINTTNPFQELRSSQKPLGREMLMSIENGMEVKDIGVARSHLSLDHFWN
ncbi:hypothetical protein QYF36_008711 [Acer negundo]|nr:hypothetical protein QYF36_008711 [Acer negundo]